MWSAHYLIIAVHAFAIHSLIAMEILREFFSFLIPFYCSMSRRIRTPIFDMWFPPINDIIHSPFICDCDKLGINKSTNIPQSIDLAVMQHKEVNCWKTHLHFRSVLLTLEMIIVVVVVEVVIVYQLGCSIFETRRNKVSPFREDSKTSRGCMRLVVRIACYILS